MPKKAAFRLLLSFGALALMQACCTLPARPETSEPPTAALDDKDLLYVAPVTVPDSATPVLEAYGWDAARFAQTLHAEVILHFRRRGIGTTDDTSKSTARLAVTVNRCERDGGVAFSGESVLHKSGASRTMLAEGRGKTQGEDPTLERMRLFADQTLKQCRLAERPKKKDKFNRYKGSDYVPQVFMLF